MVYPFCLNIYVFMPVADYLVIAKLAHVISVVL